MHQSAGKLVDDNYLALHDDVVFFPLEGDMSPEALLEKVRPFHIRAGEKRTDAGDFLGGPHAFVRQMNRFLVVFYFIVLCGVCKPGLGDVDLGMAFLYCFLSLFDSIAVLFFFRFGNFALSVGDSTLR